MNVNKTSLEDVCVLEPNVFGDERGFFYESFNQKNFNKETESNFSFVQDNHSKSAKGVLRGLHYQTEQAQGKLVRVAAGAIFDVAVDIRKTSSSFGKWFGVVLSAENKKQIWMPPGFAHGFLVLTDIAEVLYKTTDYYAPQYEGSIAWDDETLDIQWPLRDYGIDAPMLSAKDRAGKKFLEIN